MACCRGRRPCRTVGGPSIAPIDDAGCPLECLCNRLVQMGTSGGSMRSSAGCRYWTHTGAIEWATAAFRICKKTKNADIYMYIFQIPHPPKPTPEQPHHRLLYQSVIPFAGSPSEGTLRPHTAPERLGRGQGGEYHRSAARSRRGGRATSDGKFSRNFRGSAPFSSSSEDGAFDAWRKTENKTRHKTAGGCRSTRHSVFRRPSPVVRLPSTTNAAWEQGNEKRTLLKSGWEGGDADATKDRRAHLAGDGADGTFDCGGSGRGDCLSRTHILGLNGGRLPREVRQVPVDRPLTAPCGKVGRQRVCARTIGGLVNP